MGSLPLPHIVVVPIDAAGHITPFLLFAKQLASEGFTITIASSDKFTSELQLTYNSLSRELPIRFLGLRDDSQHLTHHEIFDERESKAGRKKAIRLLVELITDVTSVNAMLLRGVPTAAFPVCVVHDMLACWAQEAAERMQIEKHLLYVSGVACLSVGLQSERFAREGRVPVTPETQEIPITDIPGLPPLQPRDLHTTYLFAETYDWYSYYDKRNGKADVVLVNSFYDLEKSAMDGVRKEVIGAPGVQIKCLLDIGPLKPEFHHDPVVIETDRCILWLNTQKPSSVLYVCFGSHMTHRAPQILELALGLEASGQPFLWILQPPDSQSVSEFSGESTSVTEYLPPGFEERLKGRGMCYSGWAPQRRILAHAATGGFLTHCGWNSILESVCVGIPMLTWPFWADQNLNSWFLVDTARLAIELTREPIDPEQDLRGNGRITRRVKKAEIERQVRRLMQEEEGQSIRRNILKMKRNAQSAVASGGASRSNFEYYVWMLRAKDSATSNVKRAQSLSSPANLEHTHSTTI